MGVEEEGRDVRGGKTLGPVQSVCVIRQKRRHDWATVSRNDTDGKAGTVGGEGGCVGEYERDPRTSWDKFRDSA